MFLIRSFETLLFDSKGLLVFKKKQKWRFDYSNLCVVQYSNLRAVLTIQCRYLFIHLHLYESIHIIISLQYGYTVSFFEIYRRIFEFDSRKFEISKQFETLVGKTNLAILISILKQIRSF